MARLYTLIIVIIAWVLFRSDNLSAALYYIGNMFGIGATGFIDSACIFYVKSTAVVLIASCVGATPLFKMIMEKLKKTRFGFVESIWLVVIFLLSILQVVSSTYNPFIYFNF